MLLNERRCISYPGLLGIDFMNCYNHIFWHSRSIFSCSSSQVAARSLVITFIVVIIFASSGCSQAPSESDARKVYENKNSEKIRNGALELKNFRKVNAQMRNLMGIKVYEMEYEAEVRYPKGLNTECLNPSGWAEYFCDLDGGPAYPAGQITKQKGKLVFEETERGWKGQDGHIY